MNSSENDPVHDEVILDIALHVSDGAPVDWESSRPLDPELSKTFEKLRSIEAVAQQHRSDPAAKGALPAVEAPVPESTLFTWGTLRVMEKLGEGGFGEVWRAWDPALEREVALKLRRADARGRGARRWLEEARRSARVRHPHVLLVHGADVHDGRSGIWSDLVRGRTLADWIEEFGPLGAREAALIGIDLCAAISAVHEAGIVHGDIKATNVMREGDAGSLSGAGRIVLMDFGSAHETKESGSLSAGTPLYTAPEVLEGEPLTPAADIYALGVLLYRLVSGRYPVEGATVDEMRARHAGRQRRSLRALRPDLPPAFLEVVERAIDPEPERRFHDAAEMERALSAMLGASTARTPRRPGQRVLAAAFALGIALCGAGWWVTWQWPGRSKPQLEQPAAAPLSGTPTATFLGEGSNDLFGLALAGLGDVDQDGFDDVLIGAPQHSADGKNRGKIYLYRGTSQGLETRPSWTAVGAKDDDLFGWSIASFTNLQQDGFADLVVGACGYGQVLVYNGSKEGPSKVPAQTLSSDRLGTAFGYAVATGDVNHDGVDDLLVGEPHFPALAARTGRALLYLSNGSTLSTEPVWTATGPLGSTFGISVSLGGDVNHDGYADAVIGGNTTSFGPDLSECGAAYVFLGSPAGLDSIPTALPGRQAGALFGQDALIAGDLDADGFSDVIVGAEHGSNGEDSEGILEIYFGSKNGIATYSKVLLESNTMGANFGAHAGSVGDLDGDGCDDLFAGALRYQRTEPREGAAFVYSGSRNRQISRTWLRVRGQAGSWLGAAGGAAGDVNGDGFPDFIVSAPSWDNETGINVGQVELFLNTRKR